MPAPTRPPGLRQSTHQITVPTKGKGLHECTRTLAEWVLGSGIHNGLLTVFLQHTSASLLIQENADPDVKADLETFLARLAPEEPRRYRHTMEGADDMPAHIRAMLTATQLSIPVLNGHLALGAWQGIYIYEHRTRPHRRTMVLHLLGE